ncbi:hypothetical protein C8F04DRAFT_1066988 [Mycena alexandri]|uniref:Uncharacterized protein n=1 Tax=Mycena alexandri TaxID=1745969 RepID=A0AAD6XFD4_9AGAR|nr:hypothetical protein C8F04DRAFT_1066988 [Mycena alexandri]
MVAYTIIIYNTSTRHRGCRSRSWAVPHLFRHVSSCKDQRADRLTLGHHSFSLQLPSCATRRSWAVNGLAAAPELNRINGNKLQQIPHSPSLSFSFFYSFLRRAYQPIIMKFSAALISTVLFALTASAAPAVSIETRDVAADVGNFFGFIGGYGVQAGVDNQGGACSTPVAAARIPCSYVLACPRMLATSLYRRCPPDQGAFISTATANSQAGHTGDDAGDFTQRMFLFRDTLQGMGCPIVSTNWARLLPQ